MPSLKSTRWFKGHPGLRSKTVSPDAPSSLVASLLPHQLVSTRQTCRLGVGRVRSPIFRSHPLPYSQVAADRGQWGIYTWSVGQVATEEAHLRPRGPGWYDAVGIQCSTQMESVLLIGLDDGETVVVE